MRVFFTDRNLRRAFVLALFVALAWSFRHLLFLFVAFVVFERTLGALASALHTRTRLPFGLSVLLALGALLGGVVGAGYLGVRTLLHNVPHIVDGVDAIVVTVRRSDLYERLQALGAHVTTEEIFTHARRHAGEALHYAAWLGRGGLYLVIALVFAVVFLLERDELRAWRAEMPLESVPRVLLRFLHYTADAVAITLKLQVIVACVNTVITLPVLFVLRLPGIPALIAMILVTGLIPVVGGPAAGVVLMIVAYATRGIGGLAIFVVSTFVLHKIESYYLNPRLTARHVKLPGFVIITSLVLFEHVLGLPGVFLSFPCLYVAAKIREGWLDPEDEVREEIEDQGSPAVPAVLPPAGESR